MSHPSSTVTAMASSTREITGGSRRPSRRPVVSLCLSELRAGLAQRCDTGEVRDAVGAVVGPLLQSPLIGGETVRAADDGDLMRSAQQVQRALNALEGARIALAAEAARRELHVRRGEASVAETLASATALSGAAARRIERDAVSLQDRPQVADALALGAINADQAAAVATAEVPEEVRGELCAGAKSQTADQTRRSVRTAEAAWRSDKDLPESQRRSVAHRAADALAQLLTVDSPQCASSQLGDDSTDADPIGAAAPGEGSTNELTTGPPAWPTWPCSATATTIDCTSTIWCCTPHRVRPRPALGGQSHQRHPAHPPAPAPNRTADPSGRDTVRCPSNGHDAGPHGGEALAGKHQREARLGIRAGKRSGQEGAGK